MDLEEVESLGVAHCPEVEMIATRPGNTQNVQSTNITTCIIIACLDIYFIISIRNKELSG